MKLSMNGFRRHFSDDVQELKAVVQAIVNDECYEKKDLINALNEVIRHSNVLNCIYIKNDPDFVDMGDLEIKLLEEST